ncbi:ketol-acid reductoisomerase [Salmonella sp. NCTC 11881]|nr:ketol-acid reductoisomerase [Salmonella sp. NCTC 11881]
MAELQPGDLGSAIPEGAVDNAQLRDVNDAIRSHAIEQVGKETARLYDGYEAYCGSGLIYLVGGALAAYLTYKIKQTM